MEARVDFDRYPNAAKMCRNFLLLPQGGITRRPGTRFIKEVKTSANATRLLPFQFSQDQSYVIELGNAYARFYRRQARLEVANVTAAVSNGTFASNITGWTDPHTAAYVSGTADTTNAATYTFNDHSIGTASFDRTVVVAVQGVDNDNSGATISSVTLEGNSMTDVVQATAGNGGAPPSTSVAGIFALRYPAGTTGDIVVTFSATIDRARIDVFTVKGGDPLAKANAEDNTISASAVSADIAVQDTGCIIAVAAVQDSTDAPTGCTWTNATEQADTNPEGNSRFSCAMHNATSTEAARTITATFAGGADNTGVLAVASWGHTNRISHDTGNSGQLKFTETSAGPAAAVQALTITETTTEHVLSFIVRGEGGAVVNFQVGTTPGGNDVLEAVPCGVGYHAIAFTPGAATVYIQFRAQNSPVRVTYLDTVALLDNAPLELTSPYATADLTDLRAFQAADVMYLLHPDYAPRRLERRGHTTWSLVEAFFEDGPYNEINPGTDLDSVQLVTNPFFDNGLRGWTVSAAGNSTAQADEGFNRVKLTSDADATVEIRQQIACEAGLEHVVHYLVHGAAHASIDGYFFIGTAAGGTQIHSNTSARPKWTSVSFTPTQSEVHLTFGITDTEVSPYYVNAILAYPASAKLMRASATTGYVTVTAVGHSPFASTDVGRLIRLTWPGFEPGYGIITAYTASNQVTMLVLRKLAYASVCTEKWQFGAWSATDGYPHVIGFHDGRLIAANTDTEPQSLWASQSDSLQDMRPDSWVEGAAEVEDDDAIAVTLNSTRIDPVHWMTAQRDLVVGTAGAQWAISSDGPVITPSDISARVHSVTPSADISPAESSQVALFFDRSKREVYEIAFSFDDNAFVTTLLTILSDHIFRSPGSELAYQRLPHSIVWGEREDGRVATLSYNRAHEILGWSQQLLGGGANAADCAFVAATASTSDTTAYTFSSHSIGTASDNRMVVVFINGVEATAATAKTISSVTIGGSTATIAVQAGQAVSTNYNVAGIAYLAVPVGTTADIVVTFSGAMSRASIAVYAISGNGLVRLSAVASELETDTTDIDDSLVVPAGGCAIAGASWHTTTNPPTSATMTGFTEASDSDMEGNTLAHTGSFENGGSARTMTITSTQTGGTGSVASVMVAASFSIDANYHAIVESIAIIPGAEDTSQVNNSHDRDEVWLIVRRTIGGATVRYIEVLEGVFEGPLREDYATEDAWRTAMTAAQADAFYVDCGITYNSTSTTTITGLTHLEGETVAVLAGGRVHSNEVVASGQITLDYAVTKAQVGLPYKSRYESLKIAAGATVGTAVTKIKAVTGIGAVILDSGSFKATSVDYDNYSGRRQHDLQDITVNRDETQASNSAQPLVTGEVGISTETHYPPDPRIYIETELPLPLTILAFAPEVKATDARYTS